jgi:hypothetical protein
MNESTYAGVHFRTASAAELNVIDLMLEQHEQIRDCPM